MIGAIDAGLSRRTAAAQYEVAPSTAIRWDNERRATGSFAPKSQGGDMRSRKIEANAGVIHDALEETPDITLAELCIRLSERGIAASTSLLWRFLRRHGIHAEKRTGHAIGYRAMEFHTLNRLVEKSPGRLGISPRSQAEVDHLTVCIDSSPKMAPFATDADIGLIDMPVDAGPAEMFLGSLFQLGAKLLDPAIRGRSVDLYAALCQEIDHILIRQWILQIPQGTAHRMISRGKRWCLNGDPRGRLNLKNRNFL